MAFVDSNGNVINQVTTEVPSNNKFWNGLLDSIPLVGGLARLGTDIYNTYQQSKNLDYQKSLQQQIFQREDTAVQRRMADLEKAGLNPYMASTQSAGAGSVVSTSAPQFAGGSVERSLEMANALQSVKQNAITTQAMKYDKEIKRAELHRLNTDNRIQDIEADYRASLLESKIDINEYTMHKLYQEARKLSYDNLNSLAKAIFNYGGKNIKSDGYSVGLSGLDMDSNFMRRENALLNMDTINAEFLTSNKIMGLLAPILRLIK